MKKRTIAVWLMIALAFSGCTGLKPADEDRKEQTEQSRTEGSSVGAESTEEAPAAGKSDEQTKVPGGPSGQGEKDKEQETGTYTTLPKPEKLSMTKQIPDELEQLEIKHVYSGILTQLGAAIQLPDPATDGFIVLETEPLFNGDFFMDDNRFAICDVDGDGREELVVLYTTASMAGMMEVVYDYDSEKKELSMELLEFPAVTFYDNGIVIAPASHNHSYCATFHPCTMYQYRPETGRYEMLASYSAWSREDYPEVSVNGERVAFPEGLDGDGDGILYCISSGEWGLESYRYDRAEFEAWFAECMNGAQEILPLYYPVYYDHYKDFTPEYLRTRYQMQSGVDTGTDIGWMFHSTGMTEEVSRYVAENYSVDIRTDEEIDFLERGYLDGQRVLEFEHLNGGTLRYYDKKAEDITIFGIYPGMDAKEAKKILTAYGFYDYPYTNYDGSFDRERMVNLITGVGHNNIAIYFEADADGQITYIAQWYYCAYTG